MSKSFPKTPVKTAHPNLRNMHKEILSDQWYSLYRYSYEYQKSPGVWEEQQREAYDRGNGAAVLLYCPQQRTVVLTRQFRLPTYINGNPDGMMVEACAGLLDALDPISCIRKEILEETGYEVTQITKVFEAYMSPGSVTEILHYFIAPYHPDMKTQTGGGAADETENIEVLELSYDTVLQMLRSGKIRDGKTLLLLQYAQIHGILPLS